MSSSKRLKIVVAIILVLIVTVVGNIHYTMYVKGGQSIDTSSIDDLDMIDKTMEPYWDYIEEAAYNYGIAAEFIEAVIWEESAGNPDAKSSCGAVGLMQVREECNEIRISEMGITDLYDPESNIMVGCDILADLFEEYEEPYTVLMCYNEGEYSGVTKLTDETEFSQYAKDIVELSDKLQALHYAKG